MTARKKTSSSSSSLVRVRAEAHVIGVPRGTVLEVERTSFIEALVANGHFVYAEEQPVAEPGSKTEPDTAQDSA